MAWSRRLALVGALAGLALTGLVVAAVRLACATTTPPLDAPVQEIAIPPAPGDRLAYDSHQIFLLHGRERRMLMRTTDLILRVAPVTLPSGERRFLVLTALQPATQPRGTHLFLLDPAGDATLSPLALDPQYNFWDLSVGDVDGDGVAEVGLCTYSRTVKDPRYARRFFVYGWTPKGTLFPRFRASRLSRPYIAARLQDVNGDGRAELVAVERGPEGGDLLAVYAWNQFGFRGLAESDLWPRLTLDEDPTARALGATAEEADGQLRHFTFALRGTHLSPTLDTGRNSP